VGQGLLADMSSKPSLTRYITHQFNADAQGASPRIVVRSQAKGADLKVAFPEFADKLDLIVIENYELEGAYDSAVQGVDVVIHMASPLASPSSVVDNEVGYLIPARNGILNMLKSASKSPSIKRVVMTASSTAVVDSHNSINVP
jgi:nucleoside-diphosphate-sugar epimerase